MLSRLSVRYKLESRLRHRCSSKYLRISPLHLEFRFLRIILKNCSFQCRFEVEPQDFTPDLQSRLRALYAQ